MENSSLPEFDSVDSGKFFKCCTCKIPIASSDHYYFTYLPDGETKGVGFDEIANVEISDRFYEINDQLLVADVHCNGCKDHLGYELVEVNAAGVPQHYAGKFILKRDSLVEGELVWKIASPPTSPRSKM